MLRQVTPLTLLSLLPLGVLGLGDRPPDAAASRVRHDSATSRGVRASISRAEAARTSSRATTRPAAATPTLALAPEQAYGKLRDPSLCAVQCFEAVASYSTPAYVSLDQARAVTLVYRSGQAAPRGIVLVDATDPGPTAAAKMSIKIDIGNGTYVRSTSGATEVFYTTALGANRLAFVFSTSGDGMTSLNYKAVVTAFDANGVPSTPAEIPVRVLVVLTVVLAASHTPGLQRGRGHTITAKRR